MAPPRYRRAVVSGALQSVQSLLERFMAKDVDGVVALFAPDGMFSDPHYPPPIGPVMVGQKAIRQGVVWGAGMLEQPGFVIRHQLSGAGRDDLVAVEVDTNHVLVGGAVLAFPQVFVAELDGDGLFRRVQSYTPYPPPALP